MKKSIFIFLLPLVAISACNSGEDASPTPPGHQRLGTISTHEALSFWQNDSRLLAYADRSVEIIRITYTTSAPTGEEVIASGAVLIPVGEVPSTVISLQHSTFFADEEAPSENGLFSVNTRKAIFASAGHCVLLPDYIGYGTTKDLVHPYFQKTSLAQSSRDFLFEASSYLEDEGLVQPDPTIYLAGYSEGAYASLALANLMATNEEDVKVEMVSLGSGGFDIKNTVDHFISINDEPVGCLPCNAFFIRAYQHYYLPETPMTFFFREPYAELISGGVLDGNENAGTIASLFPQTGAELFENDFIEAYQHDEIPALTQALAANSIDQVPDVKLILTHGDQDRVAPLFNSEQIAIFAESNKHPVTFHILEGKNHFNAFIDWALITLDALDSSGD